MDYEVFEPSEEDYAEFGSAILRAAMTTMFSRPISIQENTNTSISHSKVPFTRVCTSDDKIPA